MPSSYSASPIVSMNQLDPTQFEQLLHQAISYLSLSPSASSATANSPLRSHPEPFRKSKSLPNSPRPSKRLQRPQTHTFPTRRSIDSLSSIFHQQPDRTQPIQNEAGLDLPRPQADVPLLSADHEIQSSCDAFGTVGDSMDALRTSIHLSPKNTPLLVINTDKNFTYTSSTSTTTSATPASTCPNTPRKSSLKGTMRKKKSVTFNSDEIQELCFFESNTSPLDIIDSPIYTMQDDLWDLSIEEDCSGDFKNCIHLKNLPNAMPFVLSGKHSRIESIRLTGNHVVGLIEVKNIAYDKRVIVRYSFDEWKTQTDFQAVYHSSSHETLPGGPPLDCGIDKFEFRINAEEYFKEIQNYHEEDPTRLPISKKMQFAVMYEVAGQLFWDNNYDRNYEIELRRIFIRSKNSSKPNILPTRILNNFSNSDLNSSQPPRKITLKKPASNSSEIHKLETTVQNDRLVNDFQFTRELMTFHQQKATVTGSSAYTTGVPQYTAEVLSICEFAKSNLYAEADFSMDHDFGFIHRPSFSLYTPSESLSNYVVATTTV